MFFFGYYGERWTEKAHAKIDKKVWQNEMIQGWLSYMLWKKAVDKFNALALCDDVGKDEDEKKEECVDKLAGLSLGNGKCTICRDEMSGHNTAMLKCNHAFHKNCIEKWLKNSKTCPNCRKY